MQGIKLTETNGKVTHFINGEYHYENDNITINEYDVDDYGGEHLINVHHIPENEVKEIKYV